MSLKWLKNMLSNSFFKETALVEIDEKSVLISGYKGYVGSSLLHNLPIQPVNKISNEKIDVFIHLGAVANASSISALKQNILTDSEVVLFCKENRIRLIYASGNNVYPLEQDCDEETTPLFASDYYALSKIVGENLCRLTDGLNYVVLRFGDIFGKNQRHGNLFHALQNSTSSRQPLKLYGKGLKTRNYIYIKELVRILRFFIRNENLSEKAFNVCFGTPFSVAEILSLLAQKTHLPIENIPFGDNASTRTMKNEKLIKAGYLFRYTMETALKDWADEIG